MKKIKATKTVRHFVIIIVYLLGVLPSRALDVDSMYIELDKIYSSRQFKTDLTEGYNLNKKLGNKIEELFDVHNLMDGTRKFDLNRKCAVYLISPSFADGNYNVFFIIVDNIVKIFLQNQEDSYNVMKELYNLRRSHPDDFSDEQLTNCLEYVIYSYPDGYKFTRIKWNKIKYSSGSFEYYYPPKLSVNDLALEFNRLVRYYETKDKKRSHKKSITNDKTAKKDYKIENLLSGKITDKFESVDTNYGIYCVSHKTTYPKDMYLLICQNDELTVFNTSYSKATAYDAISYLFGLMSEDEVKITNDQFRQIISRIIKKDRYPGYTQFSIFQLHENE